MAAKKMTAKPHQAKRAATPRRETPHGMERISSVASPEVAVERFCRGGDEAKANAFREDLKYGALVVLASASESTVGKRLWARYESGGAVGIYAML